MTLDVAQIAAYGGNVFWVFLRLGGFAMVAPIFGNRLVSPPIRLAAALAMSVALAPLGEGAPPLTSLGLDLLAQAAYQLLIGIGLGFAASIFFQLFVVAGQFIGMQMGLGFAAMVDPGNGVSVTVWSQYFLMLVTLVFLAMNGHLVLVEVLVMSYRDVPMGGPDLAGTVWQIVNLGGWMFASGMLIALPAVTALLTVNLAFGVMSRSAPQLNIFSLGFPFSLVFGLVIVAVAMNGWLPQFDNLAREFFRILEGVFG